MGTGDSAWIDMLSACFRLDPCLFGAAYKSNGIVLVVMTTRRQGHVKTCLHTSATPFLSPSFPITDIPYPPPLRAFLRVSLRGFDSRLSLADLLKATGASVIPLARPRKAQNGASREGLSASGAGETVPTLSWDSSSAATAAPPAALAASAPTTASALAAPATANASPASTTPASAAFYSVYGSAGPGDNGAAAAAVSGLDFAGSGDASSVGGQRDDNGREAGASTVPSNAGVDTETGSGGDTTSSSSPSAGAAPVTMAATGAGEMEAEVQAGAEARLRVISAAMRTVSAALSALSALRDDSYWVGSGKGGRSVEVGDGGENGDWFGDGDRSGEGREQGEVMSSGGFPSFGDGSPSAGAGAGAAERFGGSGDGASVGGREEGVGEVGIDVAADAAATADAAPTAGATDAIEHNENPDVTVVEAFGPSTEGPGVAAAAATATDQTVSAGGSIASEIEREARRQSQVSTPAQAQAALVNKSKSRGRYRPRWGSAGPESGGTERARSGGDDSETPPGGKVGEGAAASAAAAAAATVTAGRTRTVGAVADSDEAGGWASATKKAASYGRKLTRTAGTPTVDAIGGDVHLVAVVAGKRSLTRLLHFVDLVRERKGRGGKAVVGDGSCEVLGGVGPLIGLGWVRSSFWQDGAVPHAVRHRRQRDSGGDFDY